MNIFIKVAFKIATILLEAEIPRETPHTGVSVHGNIAGQQGNILLVNKILTMSFQQLPGSRRGFLDLIRNNLYTFLMKCYMQMTKSAIMNT